MRSLPLESVQLIAGAGGGMLLLTDSCSDKYSKSKESAEHGPVCPRSHVLSMQPLESSHMHVG